MSNDQAPGASRGDGRHHAHQPHPSTGPTTNSSGPASAARSHAKHQGTLGPDHRTAASGSGGTASTVHGQPTKKTTPRLTPDESKGQPHGNETKKPFGLDLPKRDKWMRGDLLAMEARQQSKHTHATSMMGHTKSHTTGGNSGHQTNDHHTWATQQKDDPFGADPPPRMDKHGNPKELLQMSAEDLMSSIESPISARAASQQIHPFADDAPPRRRLRGGFRDPIQKTNDEIMADLEKMRLPQ